jgi:hypothetical protein
LLICDLHNGDDAHPKKKNLALYFNLFELRIQGIKTNFWTSG